MTIPKLPVPICCRPVSLLDAQPHQCRAIVGEEHGNGIAVYCGADKREGSSYCAGHHALYFTGIIRRAPGIALSQSPNGAWK